MQQDPRYSEGFHDAWSGEPLFDDSDPIYAAGWRAYWNARDILTESNPGAWSCELAASYDKTTGEYSDWRLWLGRGKPNVPVGSIRNLRQLHAGAQTELE